MSIFPDAASGGIVVRTVAGACVAQSEAPNAYCPPATFVMNCNVTALAEDCSARVMPSQINAIVSELLCLGVALDPDGPWDCNSNCNLSTMFTTWAEQFSTNITVITDGVTIEGNGTEADPIRLVEGGGIFVTAICEDEAAGDALAACLISADENNLLVTGDDGRLFVEVATVSPITGNGTEAAPIGLNIAELISEDGRNVIVLGSDNKLHASLTVAGGLTGSGTPDDPLIFTYSPEDFVTSVCTDDATKAALADCLISADPQNMLSQGADGGLYVFVSNPPPGIVDGTVIKFEIGFSRASMYENGDLLSAYITTQGFTIPENFAESQIYARNPTGDVHIYVLKNNVTTAQILLSGGTATWTLAADLTFAVGDVLEFRADGTVEFEALAVTICAHRQILIA
jgi:hypothetical protein